MCRSTSLGGRRCSSHLSQTQRDRKKIRGRERYQEILNSRVFPSSSDEIRLRTEKIFEGVDLQGNPWSKTAIRYPGIRKLKHDHSEDSHAPIMEESTQWVATLTTEEKAAIKAYTYGSDGKINDLLLRPEKLDELKKISEAGYDTKNETSRRRWEQRNREYEEFKNLIGNIDSALSKAVSKEDRDLYRGVDLSRLTGLSETSDFDGYIKDKFSVGSEYKQESYLSTSKSSLIAVDKFTGRSSSQGLLIKIRTKHGAGLSKLSRFLSEEQEYLISRDTSFKVVKTERIVIQGELSKKNRQRFGDGYPTDDRLITLVYLEET